MIAGEFCKNALVLAGVLDPEEEITPSLLCQALDSLNLMLSSFASGPIGIPYINNLTFTTTAGKFLYTAGNSSDYDIQTPEILAINEARLQGGENSNAYNYALKVASYDQANRFNPYTLQTTPAYIFLQQQAGFGEITLWPVPEQKYQVTMMVSQKYPSYTQFENLDLPDFCQLYFKYLLASDLADIFQVQLMPQVVLRLQKLEETFNLTTTRDLSVREDYSFPVTSTQWYQYRGGWW